MSLVACVNSSLPLASQSHILFSTHALTCATDLTRIGNASNRLFQDQQGRIFLQEKTIAEVIGERILRPLIDRTSSILFKLHSLVGQLPSVLPSFPVARAEEIIISPSSLSTKEITTSNLDQTTVNLEEIRDVRGDINIIRLLLKGNVETCNNLFKQAVDEGDVISQIQLSYALFGMKQGKDDSKDFSSLSAGDLETFSYYPREFALFNSAYDQAMGVESDWRTHDSRGAETFRSAASQGYLPALLELKCKEWQWNTNSYGFAVELRPFVGKGDRQLDYYFGQALKNGCQIGSESYYEGMYWMNQSGDIQVKYPRENECFEDFTRRYIRYEDCASTYYEHDGFLHVVGSSVILAPSKEAWKAFVKEKLSDVRIAPIESYVFEYDIEQLKSLLNEHKIEAVRTGSFVESATEGRDIESLRGGTIHGFRIDSLSIYQDHERIGEISVQENTFKIHQTFKNQKLQPIIDFIENVMTRTGSAGSAYSWLRLFA